ncbi:MAG: GNAT family N-acetyltransferase [Candidatus Azobacteroides sp.]|nr:GNAT family N-acetyltransferase [Candidatus Azobacteroides sp.]
MEKISWAVADDIDLLIRLRIDFLEMSFRILTSEEKETLSQELRNYYEISLQKGTFKACYLKVKDQVAAVAFLVINHLPPSLSFPNGMSGTVLNVFTYPEFQKRGYATQVMETIIHHAKNEGISQLELHATDMGRPLYENLNFQPIPYCTMTLKL